MIGPFFAHFIKPQKSVLLKYFFSPYFVAGKNAVFKMVKAYEVDETLSTAGV